MAKIIKENNKMIRNAKGFKKAVIKSKKKILAKQSFLLFAIFAIALLIRFWWFSENVYFGFDQARDAFISQKIYLEKDIKIIGPSVAKEGLFHGPLYWYLIGPLYLIGIGNPTTPLAFISLVNALGVFLIFLLGERLFNKRAGLIAAFLYAISFAESQYALYFGNPAPAVLSILVFYLGFSLLIFSKNKWGWPLIAFGLGLSIQFEFFLIYLFLPAFLYVLFFRREIREGFDLRFFLAGCLLFLVTTLTFILGEIKFGFRITKALTGTIFSFGEQKGMGIVPKIDHFFQRLGTEVNDSVVSFFPIQSKIIAIFLILILFLVMIQKKNEYRKIAFLLVWILSNFAVDFFGAPYLYYVNIGVAAGVILIVSYFLSVLFAKNKFIFWGLLLIIFVSNLSLIAKQNPKGPLNSLYVQEGMMLEDEKQVLDKIYQDAGSKPFIFNALTMPYKIKTTWAYLFNWYGKSKYGYLPFWGGEDVPGYPGELPQPPPDLQYPRYAVIEPLRGIPEHLRTEFINSENGYGEPIWEGKIGEFVIQKRK